MQLLRALGLAVALLAGCGDNDGVFVEGPFEVTVHAPGAALVAARPSGDPADDWQALTLDADGRAVIADLEGPYAITTVCDAEGFRFVTIEAGPDDPRAWELPCAPEPIEVTVPFDDRLTLRPFELDVANADGGFTTVRTADGTRYEIPHDAGAVLVPSAALGDGDVQTVNAFARDDRRHGSGLRTARRVVTGDEDTVALELPAAVSPTMWWDPVPHAVHDLRGPWDERVYELSAEGRTWQVRALAGAATDELVVPDPATLPGWAWPTDHAFDTWSVTLVARPSPEVEQTTAWRGVFAP